MKSQGLLDIITYSEKRREILFLLQQGPCTLSDIKDYFDVTTPEIQPRIKELRDENLVDKFKDDYHLTHLGEVVTTYYKALADTTLAIDQNKDFWKNHDLSAIPKQFLINMKSLKDCKVARAKDFKIGSTHVEFRKHVLDATSFKGVTSVFNSEWVKLFSTLSHKKIKIEIIITPEIYKEILDEHASELNDLLANSNAHIYVSGDELKIAFATMTGSNGPFLSLALYNINGQHDNQNDLEGCDKASMKWGEYLFEYYKENSIEIEGVPEQNEFLFCEGEQEIAEIEGV